MTQATSKYSSQLNLLSFAEAPTSLARAGSPETSSEAARANDRAPQRRGVILRFLRDGGGATADEISAALGWSPNMVTPRLHELVGKNQKLNVTGYRAQAEMTDQRRMTRAGRWARVYRAL
jgi:predicted ArsR family transcriptional regulator